ncbi:hypothetical protein Dimus_017548 [Dionaea muscipula]
MEPEVDHYRVLEMPSGEEGAKLRIDVIKKAYKMSCSMNYWKHKTRHCQAAHQEVKWHRMDSDLDRRQKIESSAIREQEEEERIKNKMPIAGQEVYLVIVETDCSFSLLNLLLLESNDRTASNLVGAA